MAEINVAVPAAGLLCLAAQLSSAPEPVCAETVLGHSSCTSKQ